jgi:hypothetical protein
VRALFLIVALLLAAPSFAQGQAQPDASGQAVTKADLDRIVETLTALVPDVPPDLLRQQSDIAKELGQLKAKMVDLAVPDSPAFTVLGLTPEEIARPTTARTLAASLLNGVDRHGVLQSGVALDTLPYLALAGSVLNLDSYRGRNHYPVRFLARSQVSLATAKASDANDKAMKLALGIRFTIVDYGDPRTDTMLDDCVGRAIALPLPPVFVVPPPPDTLDDESLRTWQKQVARGKQAQADFEAGVAAWRTRSAAEVAKCREDTRKRAWNRTKWIAAVAPAWNSPTGAVSALDTNGVGVWTTFGYGFEGLPGLEKSAQILLHGRYRDNETVADPADAKKQIARNSRLFGVQLRAGTADSTIAGEAIFERLMPAAAAATSDDRYSIGYERRLASNLWLGVALGSGAATAGQKKGGFLLSSLKWGFAESSSLGMGQ